LARREESWQMQRALVSQFEREQPREHVSLQDLSAA
jgi:hypothetical protein